MVLVQNWLFLHPWIKTESPKLVCGNVAVPKRSKNDRSLQKCSKLPSIRHSHYHFIYGMWNAARMILFTLSSLNSSRVLLNNKDVFRCQGITKTSFQKHSGIRKHLPLALLNPCRTMLVFFFFFFFSLIGFDRLCDHTFLGKTLLANSLIVQISWKF